MHDQVALIRAILFDCNGVIVDDEPIHLKLFQKVLAEEGIPLTRKQYFEKYLALDDRSCFHDVLQLHGRPLSAKIVRDLVRRKAIYYSKTIQKEAKIFPGVKSFVAHHRQNYPMAVISGALMSEIRWILAHAGIRNAFSVIVSSEHVRRGKPDPQCYRLGLQKLGRLPEFRKTRLIPSQCLAIEDSIHGVQAAQSAGMKCLAVTNSYSRQELSHADWVVKSLSGVLVDRL